MRHLLIIWLALVCLVASQPASASTITVPSPSVQADIVAFPLGGFCDCYAHLGLLADASTNTPVVSAAMEFVPIGAIPSTISGFSRVDYYFVIASQGTANVLVDFSGTIAVTATGSASAASIKVFGNGTTVLDDIACSTSATCSKVSNYTRQILLPSNTPIQVALLTSVSGSGTGSYAATAFADPLINIDPSYTGPSADIVFGNLVAPVSLDETVGRLPSSAIPEPGTLMLSLAAVLGSAFARTRGKRAYSECS